MQQSVGIDEIVGITRRDGRKLMAEETGNAVVLAVIIQDVGLVMPLLQEIGTSGQVIRPDLGLLRPGIVAVEPLTVSDEKIRG